MGSEPPGWYVTVIIVPSFPGMSVRSLERRGVTLISCPASQCGASQARQKINFANFIVASLIGCYYRETAVNAVYMVSAILDIEMLLSISEVSTYQIHQFTMPSSSGSPHATSALHLIRSKAGRRWGATQSH